MRLRLITKPAVEPVSVDEVKAFVRQDLTDDDTLFRSLIAAAREHVEKLAGRVMISQAWEGVLDGWPGGGASAGDGWFSGVIEAPVTFAREYGDTIDIPMGPIQSATVSTIDEDGTKTAFSGAYLDKMDGSSARLILKRDQSWPDLARDQAGVVVSFVAGYGNTAVDVPGDLKAAIRILVAHWYDNRVPVAEQATAPVPHTLSAILAPYRSLNLW